jgi:hypothetical protein
VPTCLTFVSEVMDSDELLSSQSTVSKECASGTASEYECPAGSSSEWSSQPEVNTIVLTGSFFSASG